MTRLLTTIAVLTALGTASAQVPEAWKDWPPEVFDRVGVEPVELRGILGFDLVGVEPVDLRGVLGTGAAVSPVEIPSTVSARDQLMLACLKAGDVSPSVRGWLRELNSEALLKVIEAVPRTRLDHVASDAAVEALIEVHAVGEKDEGALSDKVLLRLAEYYAASGNERCVPLYERLLAKRKELADGWVPELFGLGMYYTKVGDFREMMTTFGQVEKFTNDPTVICDYYVEAARAATRLGLSDVAARFYGLIDGFKRRDWPTAVSRIDRANWVAKQGDLGAAEQTLATLVAGDFGPKAQYAGLSALGYILHRAGDAQKAQRHLAQAEAMLSRAQVTWLEELIHLSEANGRYLDCIRRFDQDPIQLSPPAPVNLRLTPNADTKHELAVETYGPIPLVLDTTIDGVEVKVDQGSATSLSPEMPDASASLPPTRRRVTLVAHGNMVRGDMQGTLRVWSSACLGYEVTLPIHVLCTQGVRIAPVRLFFGFLGRGESRTVTATVEGDRPVVIRRHGPVTADRVEFAFALTQDRNSGGQTMVRITCRPGNDCAPRVHEGRLEIEADTGAVAEIPYHVHVLR